MVELAVYTVIPMNFYITRLSHQEHYQWLLRRDDYPNYILPRSAACGNPFFNTIISIATIITYHDFLPLPRRSSHVKSDNTQTQSSNIHPLAGILQYLTPAPWFSVYLRLLYSLPQPPHVTAREVFIQVINNRAREGGLKEYKAKQKCPRKTQSDISVPELSNLSYLSRIAAQPPPSFFCCPKLPSSYPSILTSVYLLPYPPVTSAITTLLVIWYSSIHIDIDIDMDKDIDIDIDIDIER